MMTDTPAAVTSEPQWLIKSKPNTCCSLMNGTPKELAVFIADQGQRENRLIDSIDGGTLNTDAAEVRAPDKAGRNEN